MRSCIVNKLRYYILFAQLSWLATSCAIQPTQNPIDNADKYAVLVRSDNEQRHIANTAIAYQSLLENGYDPNNIYILASEGKQTFYHPVHGTASVLDFKSTISKISRHITSEDHLLIYLNGHGYKQGGNYVFNLQGANLSIQELSRINTSLNISSKLFVFDFCYDAPFARALHDNKTTTISSSQDNSGESYASENDSFSGYFFSAYSRRTHADINFDGNTSVMEAFQYARRTNTHTRLKANNPLLLLADKDEIFYYPIASLM